MKLLTRVFILISGASAALFFLTGFFEGPAYSPEQPIAFSHKIHAGNYQINCLYCHTSADRSPSAGIPSVQRCVGCHKITAADKPEVQKIHEYWNKKEPIPWVRIHENPDFVYFSHRMHIKSGFKCLVCHGKVEKMSRVRKVSSLKMGWCVKCHKANNASRDCLVCHK